MKRFLTILIILAIIVGGSYWAYQHFLSGKSFYQSIYLIPPDAALIIETDAAFDAWDNIIHSDAWKQASHIEYLAELNKEIQSVDSIVSQKSFLLRLLGRRKIMLSMHEYQPGRYDYLYIINVGKLAKLRSPEKLLSKALGDEYRLTKRLYNTVTIYELLDTSSGELYIFSFLKEKVIFSTNFTLVESAIDEAGKMTLGRNLDFIDVSKRISGRGLFNFYVNYTYFTPFLENSLGKNTEFISSLDKQLGFSAFSFEINEKGMLSLEGYTSVFESVPSFFNSVMNTGQGPLESSPVVPARVASMIKISIDNATEYYNQSISNLDPQERKSYEESLDKLQRKLKISLEENFLSWIGDEIVLLQTQPSNLGRSNEFAAIIAATNKRAPAKNMEYISRQIERNTPIKIREVPYEEFTISYISFPGLLKLLFGKMLGNIEKPYFTIIDKYVIFSNHPQTLKNIIDDYKAGNTLEHSINFNTFIQEFDRKNSALTYFDVPVLFDNLKEFVDQQTWQKLEKNKPYITSFPQVGIQLDRKDDLLHLMIKTAYSEQVEDFNRQQFDAYNFLKQFSDYEIPQADDALGKWYNPEIIINDLDESNQEGYFEDGSLHYSVGLKRGLLHGSYKEYYANGNLKVKGRFKDDKQDGTWKLYDAEENLMEEKVFSEGKEVTQ